jgi:PIN domain nuclease of toxin-antitoxin system
MKVLDASALLAFLFREPGHEMVAGEIASACISTVDLAESLGRIARDGHDPRPLLTGVSESTLEIVPFSPDQALRCARLLAQARSLGLSLGDRACLALAMERGLAAMTADAVWAALDAGVEIVLIR